MPLSSSVLASHDAPTAVLRVPTRLDGLPDSLPTLSGKPLPMPLGLPLSAIHVDGYEIVRELGRGGMGVVYLARHRRLDRYVALKMALARQYAAPEEQVRFKQEVEAVAKLNHPNIAQVYEVGEHDGFAFAAFEYVDGGTLAAWQNELPQPPREAAQLLETIARAIQHAHDHGVVHRDLKPANILMHGRGPDAVPKVTDFGLAKRLDTHSDLTATGMACGTPNYMSPEQIRGKHTTVGPATDVYGLGAVLFELLTGKPPFRGDTPMATMQAVLHNPAPSVRRLVPDLPRDLEVIVAKCLEKDPARRYSSAAALADDLDRFIENRPILARGISPVERGRRWVVRNPLAAGLFATLAVGFAVTLGFAIVLNEAVDHERELRQTLETSSRMLQQANVATENQRQAALAAQAVAEQKRKDAEAARELAAANAAQTEALLTLATDAIDLTAVRFATNPKFYDADYLRLRKQVLLDAMNVYKRLAAEKKDFNPTVMHRFARASYHYGELSRLLGETSNGNFHIQQALTLYNDIFHRHQPWVPEWKLEFARMSLMQIERADADGEMDRGNMRKHLNEARESMDQAKAIGLSEMANREWIFLEWKWRALTAYAAGRTDAARERDLGLALLEDVRPRGPVKPDPDHVDLVGLLLIRTAKAAAREDDPIAGTLFDEADELYRTAAEVWFPSSRPTLWHCRYAIARGAHGKYHWRRNEMAACDTAYTHMRNMLETIFHSVPDITPYSIEIAQAYLEIARFAIEYQKGFQPANMLDAVDLTLSRYWNLGPPCDRARRVLGESKILLAEWYADHGQHARSAEEYISASLAWNHGINDERSGWRHLGQVAFSRAGIQYAKAGNRAAAIWVVDALAREPNLTPGADFNTARIFGELALTNPANFDDDIARGREALTRVEKSGFFDRYAKARRDRATLPELELLR